VKIARRASTCSASAGGAATALLGPTALFKENRSSRILRARRGARSSSNRCLADLPLGLERGFSCSGLRSAAMRRFRTLVGCRADQVMAPSNGFASFSRFPGFAAESVLADIPADLVGPDVKFHSGKRNFHPYLTDDAICGLANGLVISTCGGEYFARPLTLGFASAATSCRATKTVGQALSSQNVSNRSTS